MKSTNYIMLNILNIPSVKYNNQIQRKQLKPQINNRGINMQQDKVKVKLSGVTASMLGCLWGRAQLSREHSSLFYDAKAVELVERIDYAPDFSAGAAPPFEGMMFNILFSLKINLPEFCLVALRVKRSTKLQKRILQSTPMYPLSISLQGLT